jgi:hypothetical protein
VGFKTQLTQTYNIAPTEFISHNLMNGNCYNLHRVIKEFSTHAEQLTTMPQRRSGEWSYSSTILYLGAHTEHKVSEKPRCIQEI